MNPAIQDGTVTVWSRPGCVQCEATVRHLNRCQVDHQVRNLDEDPSQLQEFVDAGIRQAPIVQTATATWSGYRPDLIAALVPQSGSRSA